VIVNFNVNWATQQVPFPRFGHQLKEGKSIEEFIDEVEKKVDAMIGESTVNEYKAYKNLVKHNKRINRVFPEVGAETAFCSRPPGIDKKALAIVVASCFATSLKAHGEKSSKKKKSNTSDTSSSALSPDKTKSLESSK
jgi:hypothetical protein